jgi:hypothetical protein
MLAPLRDSQEKLSEELGPVQRTQNDEKGEHSMDDQNRVLIRRGARELDRDETERVSGGLGTLTACTWDPDFGGDGDHFIGEC